MKRHSRIWTSNLHLRQQSPGSPSPAAGWLLPHPMWSGPLPVCLAEHHHGKVRRLRLVSATITHLTKAEINSLVEGPYLPGGTVLHDRLWILRRACQPVHVSTFLSWDQKWMRAAHFLDIFAAEVFHLEATAVDRHCFRCRGVGSKHFVGSFPDLG